MKNPKLNVFLTIIIFISLMSVLTLGGFGGVILIFIETVLQKITSFVGKPDIFPIYLGHWTQELIWGASIVVLIISVIMKIILRKKTSKTIFDRDSTQNKNTSWPTQKYKNTNQIALIIMILLSLFIFGVIIFWWFMGLAITNNLPSGVEKFLDYTTETRYEYKNDVFSLTIYSHWVIKDKNCEIGSSAILCLSLAPFYGRQITNTYIFLEKTNQEPIEFIKERFPSHEISSAIDHKTTKINGYKSEFLKQEIRGVTYYTYVISNKNYLVYMIFHSHGTYVDSNDIYGPEKLEDYSSYLNNFESMVHSIKFFR